VPSTDLEVLPAYLVRVRALYPGAVGVGRITGSRHLVRAEVRKMEKRGEIVSVRRFARRIESGELEIPYVRLKTVEQVRRGQRIKVTAVAAAGLCVATGAGWLLWESRTVIVPLAGVLAGVLMVAWISLHWSNGCSGIHCQGCRG
jgi:hypothetical protein